MWPLLIIIHDYMLSASLPQPFSNRKFHWRWRDLNPRLSECQSNALPPELSWILNYFYIFRSKSFSIVKKNFTVKHFFRDSKLFSFLASIWGISEPQSRCRNTTHPCIFIMLVPSMGLLFSFGISYIMRPFCLVESCSHDAAANAGVLSVLPHAYHWVQLLIDIERDNIPCVHSPCFIDRDTCYD